jgi:hypothetical protein
MFTLGFPRSKRLLLNVGHADFSHMRLGNVAPEIQVIDLDAAMGAIWCGFWLRRR